MTQTPPCDDRNEGRDPEVFCLVEVVLDPDSIKSATADIEHERAVAIFDLVDENSFFPVGHDGGPYRLDLSIVEKRLIFGICTQSGAEVATHILSLTPFRRIIRDYFLMCNTYYDAIKTAPPSRIEAIDMGRRGLHNEGAQLLCERLEGKIEIDHVTSRRLFTLVTSLHWKG